MFIAVQLRPGRPRRGPRRTRRQAGKVAAHLTGKFFPAELAPAEHAAWIGEASAKLSADVKTEAL
jgi:hypothetical protein